MGRWFEALFREAGIRPSIVDLDDYPPPSEAASWDVIVLATPVAAIEGVMETIGRFMRADALLMDISSVKQKPIHLMLKHSPSEVIGAHPLFGPSAESISNQTFFLCPVRTTKWLRPVRKFFEGLGARLVEIDPEEHDKLMACCQTLRHVMLAALGQTLGALGYHAERDADVMGMWFHQLMTMLRRQSQQPSELYADIALENPYALDALRVFQSYLNAFVGAIAAQNRDMIIEAMDDAVRSCGSRADESVAVRGWWWGLGGDSRHTEPE